MQVTRILAVRHGETAWNRDTRIQGHTDIELNAHGRWQAQRLGQALREEPITACYASDLGRALETARAVAQHHQLPVQTHAGLRERGFGTLEGQAWDAAGRHGPDQPDDTVDIDYAVEGGESLRQFQMRILSCFEELSQRNAGKNLLVFAHGGVIDMVWRKLNQQPLNAKRTHAILNTSLNFFSIDADLNWTCTQWGQLPHLNTALDEQA